MSDLSRVSFSLERSLEERLEQLVEEHGYDNRSEFLRDLIRKRLVQKEWDSDADVVGSILLVYDHERRELSSRLTHLQHHVHHLILATTHVHLDEHMCAEVIVCRGKAGEIQDIVHTLSRERGVLHAELSLGTTGRQLS